MRVNAGALTGKVLRATFMERQVLQTRTDNKPPASEPAATTKDDISDLPVPSLRIASADKESWAAASMPARPAPGPGKSISVRTKFHEQGYSHHRNNRGDRRTGPGRQRPACQRRRYRFNRLRNFYRLRQFLEPVFI